MKSPHIIFLATTTVVFPTSIQQVQIAAADIVALHSVAHSASGWVGGTNGLKGMFDKLMKIHVGQEARGIFLDAVWNLPSAIANTLCEAADVGLCSAKTGLTPEPE